MYIDIYLRQWFYLEVNLSQDTYIKDTHDNKESYSNNETQESGIKNHFSILQNRNK